MKKIFSISLLFSVTAMLFTGCVSEEDDLFSTSAAERLMQSKKVYTERLGGTTWLMEFYPVNTDEAPKGNGYLILNQFKKDGSVVQAMQNDLSDGKYLTDTSLWEVISDQGTVLSFNSYNKCIHTFSDPGLYQTGQGYEGDYEFVILSLEEGAKYGMLKGKKRSTYNRLTRLPDDTDFKAYLQDVNDFHNKVFSSSAPNDCMMNIGDSAIVFTEGNSGIASLYPFGGDPISQTTDHAFLISKNDGKYYLRFREELAGKGDDKVQEFVYDEASDVFRAVDNENNLIQGPGAAWFFNEKVENLSQWVLANNAEMSSQFKSYIDAVGAELKAVNKNFTLSNINFSYDTKIQRYQWTLRYMSAGRPANQAYYFAYVPNVDGGSCGFNFQEASGTAAENVMNRCPSLKTLWEILSQEWALTPAVTGFNLSKIKLTSKSNPDLWFVVNI